MTAPGEHDGDPPSGEHLTIWQRIERPARGPRPTLTHARIAGAAVELADAEGLDAVSMRRLAERLGVATMALYRYVAGKSDVFELMLDAVVGEIALPADAGWRAVTRAVAQEVREAGLRHPWLMEVFVRTPDAMTPHLLALVERSLASLDGLGLDVDAMMAVFGTVNAFARGATAAEVAQVEANRRRGWSSDKEARRALLPQIRWLMETGDYPTVTRYVLDGSNEDDPKWQFEFGLECVLDGIAARLGI
jgi:AcrR family transcriptional regulator